MAEATHGQRPAPDQPDLVTDGKWIAYMSDYDGNEQWTFFWCRRNWTSR